MQIRFSRRGSDRAHCIHRFPKTLAFGRGLITGLGCGESIGSSVVKRSGSPSGDGTSTRCGRFGSGNFGPPARGSFTISRFVMIIPSLGANGGPGSFDHLGDYLGEPPERPPAAKENRPEKGGWK